MNKEDLANNEFMTSENSYGYPIMPESDSGTIFTSLDVIYTFLFSLFALAVILPPTEMVSAGLTVENVFSNILGSEQLYFVFYHIKRSALVRCVHSFLPLVYYLFMCQISESVSFLTFFSLYGFWELWIITSVLLPAICCLQIHMWYRSGWRSHPIVRRLTLLANSESQQAWVSVANVINTEFRRHDKFVTGPVPSRRIAITDNWIIQASTYDLLLAHQSDSVLTVETCEEHVLSPDSLLGTQILSIAVTSVSTRRLYFRLRLNANDFQSIKEKLTAPLRHAQGIVVRQSLSEQFIEAFRETIKQNNVFHVPTEMDVENCIGCMQIVADVKLVKQCDQATSPSPTPCQSCYCRPMWCHSCMARWFASRQLHDGHDTATWMTRQAPCPTCRATFCMLDVCYLDTGSST